MLPGIGGIGIGAKITDIKKATVKLFTKALTLGKAFILALNLEKAHANRWGTFTQHFRRQATPGQPL
jgi:hypothetical protein